jgi:hypothetical protein
MPSVAMATSKLMLMMLLFIRPFVHFNRTYNFGSQQVTEIIKETCTFASNIIF